MSRNLDSLKEVWNANGLYASNVRDELHEIHDFLKNHPTQIVILHFNHGWNEVMEKTEFKQLNDHIQ